MKHWITLNEQYIFTFKSYVMAEYAPGRGAEWDPCRYLAGNSGTEPYIVGHNLILAHAAAVNVYKTKYQVLFALFFCWSIKFKFGGNVYISLNPFSN